MCCRCYSKWYKTTQKGIESEQRYLNSKKGKAANLKKTLKYQASDKGKKVLQKYYNSDKYLNWSKNKCAKRRASKFNATPSWADLEAIKNFYNNCPKGYEVDHIIPLKHDKVCGLHVLENLQYLTKSENSSKCNKFDGTIENESWRIK